jgi:hypothetical protein
MPSMENLPWHPVYSLEGVEIDVRDCPPKAPKCKSVNNLGASVNIIGWGARLGHMP